MNNCFQKYIFYVHWSSKVLLTYYRVVQLIGNNKAWRHWAHTYRACNVSFTTRLKLVKMITILFASMKTRPWWRSEESMVHGSSTIKSSLKLRIYKERRHKEESSYLSHQFLRLYLHRSYLHLNYVYVVPWIYFYLILIKKIVYMRLVSIK